MDSEFNTRAAMIAAPGSGHGKTIVTAALARQLVNQGLRVQLIKIGPDYLDPMLLERASGQVVRNLDWWIMGEEHCRNLLSRAMRDNDVVLVESMMGVHDNQPSSAWVSRNLDLPVVLVMDLGKLAQTAAAVVHGMCHYAGGMDLSGVIGNLVASDHHHRLIVEAMSPEVPYFGSVRRDNRLSFPSRHLGLVQAGEIEKLDERLDDAARFLVECDIKVELPHCKSVTPDTVVPVPDRELAGTVIAVARDDAFRFIYPGNVEQLETMGASLRYFSPLANEELPDCDALWLPGGYPELHLDTLHRHRQSAESVAEHWSQGKPLLAECGGMMYLGKEIIDQEGRRGNMCGVFDASSRLQTRVQGIGHQMLKFEGGALRGHAFHHSNLDTAVKPADYCQRQNGNRGEAVFRSGKAWLSYCHFYFPSDPSTVSRMFRG